MMAKFKNLIISTKQVNAKFGGICQQFKLNKFVTPSRENRTAQCQTGTGDLKFYICRIVYVKQHYITLQMCNLFSIF